MIYIYYLTIIIFYFFFLCSRAHRDLHSFPTRRSSDQRTARALAHGPGALGIEHFPSQIRDVMAWLRDQVEPGHAFAGVRAMPVGPTAPEVWLLGSSAESASYAAHFGTA